TGKRESHGKSNIAGVKHGWMNREREVLQYRVQIGAVLRRRNQALERIRGPQRKQQEAAADQSHDAEHTARETHRQLTAERSDRDAPDRQNQDPQQQRAFVRSPHGSNAIEQRQVGVRVSGDVQHRKIAVDEGIHKARESDGHEHELTRHCGTGDGHPDGPAAPSADEPEKRLRDAEAECQDKGKYPEFRCHLVTPTPQVMGLPAAFCFNDAATSGGMYFSSCLASTSSATNAPLAPMVPCAMMPCPSRNRSGSTPVYSTGIWW